MRLPRDESGVVVSWLIRVLLFLAVIGIVLYDAGAIVVNVVTLDSAADDIANSISIDVSEASLQPSQFADSQIFDMAKALVKDEATGVAGARVVRRGTGMDENEVVHVRLRRTAPTIVAKWIGFFDRLRTPTGSGQAGTT